MVYFAEKMLKLDWAVIIRPTEELLRLLVSLKLLRSIVPLKSCNYLSSQTIVNVDTRLALKCYCTAWGFMAGYL